MQPKLITIYTKKTERGIHDEKRTEQGYEESIKRRVLISQYRIIIKEIPGCYMKHRGCNNTSSDEL